MSPPTPRWASVRRPSSACTHSGFFRCQLWRAQSAIAVASVSPAANARNMARPLLSGHRSPPPLSSSIATLDHLLEPLGHGALVVAETVP